MCDFIYPGVAGTRPYGGKTAQEIGCLRDSLRPRERRRLLPVETMQTSATEIIELTKLAAPKRTFGEYLVTHRVLDRFQLFRALQMQDRHPRARVGSCAVALGYAKRAAIETLHVRFTDALDAELEAADTEAFIREHEPEILIELAS